jgi:peptidyl-prolyl cis-trans isomerase D
MFDFVAKHKRLLQVVLIALILPPFAFFGIQSFERMRSGGSDLANVEGSTIGAQEFNRAVENQREQLRAALGRNFDPALLDTPEVRKQLLDDLIAQRVLALYASRNRLVVTDEQLRDLLAAEPAFQENDKFSRSRYQALMRSQNLTEAEFEQRLRNDLVMRQLGEGLIDSGIVSSTVARRFAAIRAESREISESMIQAKQFLSQVNVTPAAIESYYKAHAIQFEVPEQVRAQYVVLSLDGLIADESVGEAEVKAAYEASMGAQRREREAARKKAETLLAAARKEPSKFAELAKANSQDTGSAAQGGDLGWFGRGAMVKPFEAAVFKLKEDEIGPLVESDFGFHIIRLTGIRKAERGKSEERRASHILINAPPAKDFDSARAGIERDLKRGRAQKKFAEAAESFSNIAYEQPDSLQPLVDRFKLKIATTDWFSLRNAPADLASPKLLAALFGEDAIRNKRNTEAIETAPARVVVGRVLEHKPAAMRPLDEVRGEITKTLSEQEALKLAREAGAARLKALQSGETAAVSWGPARAVTRENAAGLDPRAIGPIFRADADKLPAYVGVDLPPTGYALYRVAKVTAGKEADESKRRANETGLARQEAREAYQAFIGSLRSRADIEIFEQNLAAKER